MNPTREDDLYRQALLGLSLATPAQIEEALGLQSKIQEIGIREPLGELLLKKGYLTQAGHEQVLRQIGKQSISIPGFTILAKIGQGGMGTVYKALQASCQRTVAIKVIAAAATKDPSSAARFVREAKAVGSLHHPNLVAAIDVGQSEGSCYLVMEFVAGKSCRELVRTKGPFPLARVLDIALQMVEALSYIHEQRLVHRDVKPENMLLTEEGQVKLCDFGLAKSIGDVDAGLTQEGFTVGTPLFMSPEQVRGDRDIDIRSDLYSLGASLFYLLTGKAPYEGKSAAETMSMHLKQPVPDARQLNPQVSEDMSSLIHKLLSKERKDRYPSPRELKDDLERIQNGSAPRHARQHAFGLQISSKAKIPQRATIRRNRSRWPLVAAVAGGLAALLVFFMGSVVLGGPKEARPASGAPEPGRPPRPAAIVVPEAVPEPGKAEYMEALEIAKLRPDDLAGRARALERAIRKGKDGPCADSARRDLGEVNARLRKELGSVEERAKGLLAKEQFKEALDLWSAVQHLHDLSTWSEAVAVKIEEIDRIVVERFAGLREQAIQARDRQDLEALARLRSRTTSWGLPTYLSEFEGLLAPADPETPPAPAPAPKAPPEGDVSWPAAVTLALRRDYPLAVRTLASSRPPSSGSAQDAANDRENFLLAGPVASEALTVISSLAKGQPVALGYADAHGRPARIQGRILASGSGRIELLRDESPVTIPLGEIQAGTLAEFFVSRPKDPGASRKAAALFCLIEGDPETARRLQGDPPPEIDPKYWDWAHRAAEALAREEPLEAPARRLFYEAERLHFEPGAALEAAAKYRELLEKHGTTLFVRRNQSAILARTELRKDFVFSASELASRGGFRLVRSPGKTDALVCQKDQDPGEMKETYVQAEFSALADREYRCWVYAGGCCQEVFGFAVQGDEITVPKAKSPKETLEAAPGSSTWAPAKSVPPFLRRKHVEHGGQKQADKWAWIPVPLPRYGSAGTKTLRILTDQKGFSIGMIVVSAQRGAPPREADLKDLERLRAEEPGYASWKTDGGGPAGEIRRELWEGIGGIWVRDLTGSASFPDRPTRVETLKAFEIPPEGTPNTGSRIRGYIHAPATGAYVFWIAADDTGELWLSSDDRPENRILIASAPEWTGYHEWEKQAAQKSRPVTLRAGHRYYIEALEKQGGGGMHLAVGWQLPDGTQERPIPARYLSPYGKR
jgi:serine/threonine-protein kinase